MLTSVLDDDPSKPPVPCLSGQSDIFYGTIKINIDLLFETIELNTSKYYQNSRKICFEHRSYDFYGLFHYYMC